MGIASAAAYPLAIFPISLLRCLLPHRSGGEPAEPRRLLLLDDDDTVADAGSDDANFISGTTACGLLVSGSTGNRIGTDDRT